MALKNLSKSGFWAGLFTGGALGCVVCAVIAVIIFNAPIPFVEKVQRQAQPVDATALDGKDPNVAMYDTHAAEKALSTIKTVEAPTANRMLQEEATPGVSYRIQAGAFRQAKDAENVLTKLAFIGLEADVVKSTDAGVTLHRVFLGPFDTPKEANDLQQRLASEGIDCMVIRNQNKQ